MDSIKKVVEYIGLVKKKIHVGNRVSHDRGRENPFLDYHAFKEGGDLGSHHQPLRWLMELNKLTGKLTRWALLLQDYDFEVVHRAGITNLDANGLSRNPSPSDEDLIGAR